MWALKNKTTTCPGVREETEKAGGADRCHPHKSLGKPQRYELWRGLSPHTDLISDSACGSTEGALWAIQGVSLNNQGQDAGRGSHQAAIAPGGALGG